MTTRTTGTTVTTRTTRTTSGTTAEKGTTGISGATFQFNSGQQLRCTINYWKSGFWLFQTLVFRIFAFFKHKLDFFKHDNSGFCLFRNIGVANFCFFKHWISGFFAFLYTLVK